MLDLTMDNVRGGPKRYGRVAVGIVLVAMWSSFVLGAPAAGPSTALAEAGAVEETNAPPPVTPAMADTEYDAQAADFWRDALSSAECDLATGDRSISGAAIVQAPTESGSAFRVVDGSGTLFEGTLPFEPNGTWLRGSLDGRVLAGFSRLQVDSRMRRDHSAPEPAVVYRDGEKIYETNKAWSFGIAPDGSAFYTIEPEADDTSNLIIRDHGGTVLRSHDLKHLFTERDEGPPFLAKFTNEGDEVMLVPGSIYQDHVFYPVGQGKSLAIQYRGQRNLWGGVIASSRTGFHVYAMGGNKPLLVVRERYDWTSPAKGPVEVWATKVDLLQFFGRVHLSSDNRYLLLSARNMHLLDAETGQVLFAYPTAKNLGRALGKASHPGRISAVEAAYKKADRKRLAGVVKLDKNEDPGAISSHGFRDGELYLYRRIGLAANRQCMIEHVGNLEDRDACVEGLRASGRYSEVLDLFDLASIQIDSQPGRRIVVERNEYECRPGPKSALEFEGDTLRYVGRED